MRKILLLLLLLPFFGNTVITPVFTCGTECGVGGTVGQHWNLDVSASFSTSTVRSGARSIRCNPSAAATGDAGSLDLTASNKWVIRGYVFFASLPSTSCRIITVGNGKNTGAWFNNSDSKIYSYDGAATGATGVSVTTGQWYRIDISADLTSNPWLVNVNVDGSSCGQASRATGTSTGNTISLGHAISNTYDIFFDDVIASFTLADYPIGAGYVNHFVTTSDGSHSGLTTNDFARTLTGTDILNSTTDSYLLLDDVPLESGSSVDWINMLAPVASTYVENVFGPASGISTPTVAPRMASIIIGIHAAGTGAYNAEWLLNDNGTTASIFTASAVAGSTTVIYKTLNLADPPSAASVWTLSGNGNFNNIRVRFGPTASVDANPDVYFDCAMIEAEFEEIALTVPGTPSDKRHTTLGVGSYALLTPHSKQIIKQSKQQVYEKNNSILRNYYFNQFIWARKCKAFE